MELIKKPDNHFKTTQRTDNETMNSSYLTYLAEDQFLRKCKQNKHSYAPNECNWQDAFFLKYKHERIIQLIFNKYCCELKSIDSRKP